MTQVVDTDGHIFERDEIMFEYLEPPYKGHKEVFLYPFFPPPDGFHRMARRIVDKRPYIVGPDDPKTWAEFFFHEKTTPDIYSPSLHDALPSHRAPCRARLPPSACPQ